MLVTTILAFILKHLKVEFSPKRVLMLVTTILAFIPVPEATAADIR